MFAGTGAIVVERCLSGGQITHVGVALTFGLVVLALIYAVGDVSGAHLNPAVSVAFAVAGRFPRAERIAALRSRPARGGVSGERCALAFPRFPDHTTLEASDAAPAGTAGQSFVLELILTLILMFVALSVATGAKERGLMAGVAVGGVVTLEALFAGPVCGASMNPARSLAPAVVSGRLDHLWLYLIAPTVGARVWPLLSVSAFTTGAVAEPPPQRRAKP